MNKSKRAVILPKYEKLLEIVGENIKLARKRRKLLTEQVSERAGIHRATLNRVEKGDPSVAMGIYFNVLKTLGLHQDILRIAEDDVFGRKLQDIDLLTKDDVELGVLKTYENKLRNSMYLSSKRKFFNKKLESIIGITYNEFENYLENNEYGFKVGDKYIDIDHIIPIITVKNKEDIDKLFHYSNLQLLPSLYNRNIKSNNKWNKVDFDKWFKTF